MKEFREALEKCALSDLGYQGPRFTWSNNTEGKAITKERLNRGLGNFERSNLYTETRVNTLATQTSDHCPLFIEMGKIVGRREK